MFTRNLKAWIQAVIDQAIREKGIDVFPRAQKNKLIKDVQWSCEVLQHSEINALTNPDVMVGQIGVFFWGTPQKRAESMIIMETLAALLVNDAHAIEVPGGLFALSFVQQHTDIMPSMNGKSVPQLCGVAFNVRMALYRERGAA